MIETIKQTMVTIRKCAVSMRHDIFTVAFEAWVLLVILTGGGMIVLDYLHGRWEVWVVGISMVLLCISMTFRNFSMVRLHIITKNAIETQHEVLVALEDQNEKLRQVALSAVALKTMIEHGLPPNLSALRRDLNALRGNLETDLSKMN